MVLSAGEPRVTHARSGAILSRDVAGAAGLSSRVRHSAPTRGGSVCPVLWADSERAALALTVVLWKLSFERPLLVSVFLWCRISPGSRPRPPFRPAGGSAPACLGTGLSAQLPCSPRSPETGWSRRSGAPSPPAACPDHGAWP